MSFFMNVIIGVIVIAIAYFAHYFYTRRNLYKCSSQFIGPPSLPFIGNAHMFLGKSNEGIFETFLNILSYAQRDGITKLWLGPHFFILPTNPDWIQLIMKNELNKAGAIYKFTKPYVSNSILLAPVSVWKPRRKMLSPAFNQKHIDSYTDNFLQHTKTLIKKMSVELDKNEFDVFEYVKLCAMDIISESALHFKSNYQKGENLEMAKIHAQGLDLTTQRMMKIWLQIEWFFNLTSQGRLHKYIIKHLYGYCENVVRNKNLIDQNTESIEYKGEDSVGKSYLEILIENAKDKNVLNREDRNGEVVSVTVAGSDTTTTEVSFILLILGSLPHIQEKVIEELNDIFGESERSVTKDDIPKMKYLDCVLKESMRLFPVLPLIGRTITQDMQLGKYKIPAGAGCIIFIYQIHRDAKIWGPDVNEFNPDRFLPENSADRHPFGYMPFSAGPRDCLGKRFALMSMKIMLCEILRAYEIRSTFNYKKVNLSVGVAIRPTIGYKISIKSRKPKH